MSKDRTASPAAVRLWSRRADALEAGTVLLRDNPDRTSWSAEQRRLMRYALAVSRRLEKLQ